MPVLGAWLCFDVTNAAEKFLQQAIASEVMDASLYIIHGADSAVQEFCNVYELIVWTLRLLKVQKYKHVPL